MLAAKHWPAGPGAGTGQPRNVLAIHGWTDNAASFDLLAPRLATAGCNVVAVDLPGHGLSSHRPQSLAFGYSFFDYASTMAAAVDALGWRELSILGHSMVGISCTAHTLHPTTTAYTLCTC